jgi:hypothetical protein
VLREEQELPDIAITLDSHQDSNPGASYELAITWRDPLRANEAPERVSARRPPYWKNTARFRSQAALLEEHRPKADVRRRRRIGRVRFRIPTARIKKNGHAVDESAVVARLT